MKLKTKTIKKNKRVEADQEGGREPKKGANTVSTRPRVLISLKPVSPPCFSVPHHPADDGFRPRQLRVMIPLFGSPWGTQKKGSSHEVAVV